MRAVTHGVTTSCWSGTAFASSRDCKPHEKAVWRVPRRNEDVADSVTCFGAVPHSSVGAEPSRGARRHSCQGAALISPHAPVADGPQGLPRVIASAGPDAKHRRRYQTQRVSPLNTIRATHPAKARLPASARSPHHTRRRGLLQAPGNGDEAACQLQHAAQRRSMVIRHRLTLEQLRLGEERRERLLNACCRVRALSPSANCPRTRASSRTATSSSLL